MCTIQLKLAKYNLLNAPTSWQDLTDPEYMKDIVAMPNPNSSGTGFLDVASWIQIFGEDGGWSLYG